MSRSRDIADAGAKVNYLDNVTANLPADVATTYAPLASSSGTDQTSLAFENVMTSTDYNYYKIYGAMIPASDGKHIYARWGYGGGSTTYLDAGEYINTGYKSYSNGSASSSATQSGTWSYAFYATNTGNASTDPGIYFEYTFHKPWLTNGTRKTASYTYMKYEDNNYIISNNASVYNQATALLTQGITAIKFYASDSANITGEMQLYGLKNS